MRRRGVYAELAVREVPPTAPIKVIWAEPAKAKPGHCPKCGEHYGRGRLAHAEKCSQQSGHMHDAEAT